jgi:benzoyl-CoA reductase subunit C
MSFETIVEECRTRLAQPLGEAVAAWKSTHPGGKAIGCFPVYTPLELMHAGGMFPVGLWGGGTTIELAYADARFQSFVCSIAKTTLELGLQGRLKPLDGAVFHSICDVARNLGSVYHRNFPGLYVEYLHLPQSTNPVAGAEYLASEYRRLQKRLEDLLGHPITDDQIRDSIAVHNDWRRMIRELYRIRRETPHLLSLAESYTILRSAGVMPIEEHTEVLQKALDALVWRSARPRDRIKVIIEGAFCEQPPIGLLEVLEEAGCYILDDDLLVGWRWFTQDVPVDGDPVARLAESYINRGVYSSVRHDWRRPKAEGLVEKVRQSGAEAVIFMPAKFCEPALFDYVLYREALEKAGISHLLIEFEEKMWTFERTRNEVETFVESMLFD